MQRIKLLRSTENIESQEETLANDVHQVSSRRLNMAWEAEDTPALDDVSSSTTKTAGAFLADSSRTPAKVQRSVDGMFAAPVSDLRLLNLVAMIYPSLFF